MRNKYNQPLQQQQQQKSNFLPMLCSSSSKHQVKHCHRPLSEEPSSPRVGCMGQVKRNNKVSGFPVVMMATHNLTAKNDQYHSSRSSSNNFSVLKYHKLKRFFSNESLNSSPQKEENSGRRVNINRERGKGFDDDYGGTKILCRSKIDENSCSSNREKKGCSVNLEELDPPLPVVKRISKQQLQEEEGKKMESVSLWKRRSGGAPLTSLQLQLTHQISHAYLPVNTV